MSGLTPTFTRDELLKKTIVDLRQNDDLEFGYIPTADGLAVAFLKNKYTFECINNNKAEVASALVHGTFNDFVYKNISKIENDDVAEIFNRLNLKETDVFKSMILEKTGEQRAYATYNFMHHPHILNREKVKWCFDELHKLCADEDRQICDFLDSTNMESPFDEVVVRHYLTEETEINKFYEVEIYTYIKVVDRIKNIVNMERYYHDSFGWHMIAKGTYNIGHTANDFKSAIRKSAKSTVLDNSIPLTNNEQYLAYDFGGFIYAWYKALRERTTEVREVTGKLNKASDRAKREYVPNATANNRRVVTIGKSVVVYTKNEQAIKSIKKRKPVWHVDYFERRGSECHYHRKDGTILVYNRKGSVVRPKKNPSDNDNDRGITYILR